MEYILVIVAFVLGLTVVVAAVPPLLKVARAKNLFEPFNERKVHTQIIPPLGGVAIFFGFILSTIIATDGLRFDSLKYIIAAVIIMFAIGLKDDLLDISMRKKLIVQIAAAIVLITLADVRFTNLHGILGIYELNYSASFSITLFAMIGIINAYNLIDGVDGLASGLAIIAATSFGTWFYFSDNFPLAIMSFSLVGSLTGFFVFNVFGKKTKLFMGDTGSLIIGIVLSTLVIRFNELNISHTVAYHVAAAPIVSFAIIFVPIIDTFRVMTIRIMQRKSPFTPDRNHIHHKILGLTPNHLHVTLIILGVNILVIGLAIWFNSLAFNMNLQFLLIIGITLGISSIPSLLLKGKNTKRAVIQNVKPASMKNRIRYIIDFFL